MVWGILSYRGRFIIYECAQSLNANRYIEILEERLLPFINRYHPEGAICQQDGAAPHKANKTLQFLSDCNVDIMQWPARSPDLNPIENVWGALVREVYKNGMQYDTVDELRSAIKKGVKSIKGSYLRSLVRSVPKRAMNVLERGGRHCVY